jgi:hypothetical protein
MGIFLALILSLAPAARAAGTAESELGAAIKWDILTAARRARAEIPDACLCSVTASLAPDGDSFRGHFWSEKNAAHYIVLVRAHSQVPDDPEKGDVSASPLCIREVPIGADRAIAIALKHGLAIGSDMKMNLELLKIDKESMGDDHFIYNNVRAARGHVVWVVIPGEFSSLQNAWIIEAVAGRFIAHGDYSQLPMSGD